MRAWLNGSLRAPLEDHNKITNGSSSRCVSHKWRWSCDSMKICKSYPTLNMPQYGIECMIGQKNQMMSNHLSANVQSRSSTFVIESDLSVQKALLKESMMTFECRKVWAWLSGSREAPLGDRDKITKMSSPRRVSCNWGWSCKSMKIRKSHPKQKYTLVWHRIRQHQIINHQICNPGHPNPLLKRTQTSMKHPPEEEAWWHPNINQILNTCPSRGYPERHLIPWPQGGLKTWDVT